MLVNNESNNIHVKFVSYDGKYPYLCSGKLILEIDDEQVTFGDYDWNTKKGNIRFWSSGGSCGFTSNYEDSYVNKGKWYIDVEDIPEKYRQYANEIDEVFNDNVPWGCCGGCL